ncbi:MAG TPA: ATP-binding cassette domain-containing protein [Stackebrandtia sp.]|jgi:ABC-2 type transport system ATP-binding protein|uniref:ABC transporter ATP-binding protein n=1 Tax=Stackebrandtia sp. TaxID=2023065 RepID=UPI002D5A89C7|nr:ATP-binding cassette domain-containing protein [Stackebrandtia sp.]HZE38324.1 ATP-binding cassette domain-containing protein [Stackebrandtia sp.]
MLEIRNLHKRFGDTVALDGVTLTVEPGQMFGFVGANGAGKTTTMRIAMGLLESDAGEVTLDGGKIGFDQRVRIGYMPEERGLYPKMKIGEQITYFGELHGMTPAVARRATDEWLTRLGLSERAGDFVQDLSLGNQQRVQLAVSLVHEPKVLILDEPFSGLDPIAVDTMAAVLVERARAGVPVIFSSHQLDLVERLCDSVGIISAGQMVAAGTVKELRQKGNRKLRVVLEGADPSWADRLPGEVVNVADGEWVIDSTDDDQKLLAAAMNAGRVVRFGFDEPSLVDVFREAVA